MNCSNTVKSSHWLAEDLRMLDDKPSTILSVSSVCLPLNSRLFYVEELASKILGQEDPRHEGRREALDSKCGVNILREL